MKERPNRSSRPIRAPLGTGAVLVGTWRVGEELAVTRSGRVFRAVHTRTGLPAAVKILTAIDERKLKRFEREAVITASLASPNSVRVLDYGRVADGTPFMVMELLEGKTLRAVMDERDAAGYGPIPAGAAIAIADSVLRALMEAHREQLVHRSVKPANIFLQHVASNDVCVRLVDFGIAKDLEAPMTAIGETLGTPSHMSPEQIHGKEIDGRSDLYSLGVVLYECLTGTLPFSGTTGIAMAVAHSTQRLEPVEVRSGGRVDGALAAVINTALAKDPADRWPDAQAMRDALLAVAGTENAGAVLGGPADIMIFAASAPPPLPPVAPPAPTPVDEPATVQMDIVAIEAETEVRPRPRRQTPGTLPIVPGRKPSGAQPLPRRKASGAVPGPRRQPSGGQPPSAKRPRRPTRRPSQRVPAQPGRAPSRTTVRQQVDSGPGPDGATIRGPQPGRGEPGRADPGRPKPRRPRRLTKKPRDS